MGLAASAEGVREQRSLVVGQFRVLCHRSVGFSPRILHRATARTTNLTHYPEFAIVAAVCYDEMMGGPNMTPTMKSLGIDQLPRDVRVALVHEIWDSIAAETVTVPLSDAQRAELERRIADDDANPDDVVPWEEVKAKALARLKR